ncbi:hypothetical protein CEXT_434991 [Caerostris extrusa]|uniref:Secreted protein n=1 Tax=Caerostris extrusa TaxID=172846 RepID=A0AAV4RQI4_CAEEX|nr:hypothetical protein CEXT_434991 [Caerostris extrusa]
MSTRIPRSLFLFIHLSSTKGPTPRCYPAGKYSLPPVVVAAPSCSPLSPSVTVGSSLWKKVEKRVLLFAAERGTAARLRMQYFRMEMP